MYCHWFKGLAIFIDVQDQLVYKVVNCNEDKKLLWNDSKRMIQFASVWYFNLYALNHNTKLIDELPVNRPAVNLILSTVL